MRCPMIRRRWRFDEPTGTLIEEPCPAKPEDHEDADRTKPPEPAEREPHTGQYL